MRRQTQQKIMVSICLLSSVYFMPQVRSKEKKEQADPAVLAKEAALSARANLHSGIGNGTYEIYTQKKNQRDLVLEVQAKVKICFLGSKYNVNLNYEEGKSGSYPYTSRIIIYDGKTIASSRFSPLIRPRKAAGDIFKPEDMPGATAAGFAFDPSDLLSAIVDIAAMSRNLSANNPSVIVSYSKLPGGGYTGKYKVDNVTCEWDVLPKFGFNVAALRVRVPNEGRSTIIQDYNAEWAQSEDVWFVKKIVQQFNRLDGSKTRTVFAYHKFQPNAKVSPDLFQLSALQLPPRTRILDHRPEAKVQEYWTPPNGIPDSDKLDSLLEEAKQLPHFTYGETPTGPKPRTLWRKYLALVGGILLCVVGLLLLWKRRRRGNLTSEA